MLGMVRADPGVRTRLQRRVAEQHAEHLASLSGAGARAAQYNMTSASLHSRSVESIRSLASLRVRTFDRSIVCVALLALNTAI